MMKRINGLDRIIEEKFREYCQRYRRKTGREPNPNVIRDLVVEYIWRRPSLWYPHITRADGRVAWRKVFNYVTDRVADIVFRGDW